MPCDRQTIQLASEVVQTQNNKFSCIQCGKVLARQYDLTRHMKTHAENKEELKFKCIFEGCNHSSLQKGNLMTHMRRHTGEKNQLCPDEGCDYKTCDPAALTRHRKAHHAYEPLSRSARDKSVKSEGSRYRPYHRVPQTKEIKLDYLVSQGVIKKDMLASSDSEDSASSSSSLSSSTSLTTSPTSSISTSPALSSSDSSASSSSPAKSEMSFPTPTCDPSQLSLQPFVHDISLSGVFGMSAAPTFVPQPAELSSSCSGTESEDFAQMLASFGTEQFTASLYDTAATTTTSSLASSSTFPSVPSVPRPRQRTWSPRTRLLLGPRTYHGVS